MVTSFKFDTEGLKKYQEFYRNSQYDCTWGENYIKRMIKEKFERAMEVVSDRKEIQS
jgi:hypothetical protein